MYDDIGVFFPQNANFGAAILQLLTILPEEVYKHNAVFVIVYV